MSTETQTPDKPQLKIKLLRRIFYFILVVFIFPAMIIPLRLTSEGDVEQSEYFDLALVGVLFLTLILIGMAFFSIAPVVMELLDARKKERDENEDLGMFP